MDKKDQEYYGFQNPGEHPKFEDDPHPPVKTNKLERDEQRQFASWLMLNNYKAVWHRTDKASTANAGVPDFIVPVLCDVLWIEFKLPGAALSKSQEEFKAGLALKGHTLYVCFSAGEAIALVKQKDRLT